VILFLKLWVVQLAKVMGFKVKFVFYDLFMVLFLLYWSFIIGI
jgi:hypothetical protein